MKRQNRRTGRRGMSLVEVLVAALILGVSLAAMVGLWYFSANMTASAEDTAVAYNLARKAIEGAKETGFFNTPEASTSTPVTHYYDASESLQDGTPSAARYRVTTSVVSSSYASGSTTVPANNATRTVIVTVFLSSNGSALYSTGTYLVRSGF